MSEIPAGWYDDGRGAVRWWDGTRWTEHVQGPAPLAPGRSPYAQQPYEQQANAWQQPGVAQPGVGQPGVAQQPYAPQQASFAHPGVGQQAFGQPAVAGYPYAPAWTPPGAATTRSRRATGWLIAAIAAVLVVILAMGTVLLAHHVEQRTSPQATVSEFANRVLMAESCSDDVVKAFNTLTSSHYRNGTTATCATIGTFTTNPPGYAITTGAVLSRTSTRATVTLTITGAQDSTNGTYVVTLVKEDGSWKVDSLTLAQQGSGGSGGSGGGGTATSGAV